MKKLLSPYAKGGLSLKNHIVMAPMTRSRATSNIPNELMATYYGQRAAAGLIVTEGTAPAPEALGYVRIPGIFHEQQINGWKKVTEKVHTEGGKIFIQLMHTGRIGHNSNLPEGYALTGPSPIKAKGQIFTDTMGMQDYSDPIGIETEDLPSLIEAFTNAAKNAIEAGFDGVEIHGANGYLLEQFLHPEVNNRTDDYGGTIENRARLTLDIAKGIAAVIGSEKTGIRLSPFSTLGDLQPYDSNETERTYAYLSQELDKLNIAYIHINANPAIPKQTYAVIRANFTGTIILCNNITPGTAEQILDEEFADIIAFGRPFLANPDLIDRIAMDAPLNEVDYATAYTPGEKGYTDYPFLMKEGL